MSLDDGDGHACRHQSPYQRRTCLARSNDDYIESADGAHRGSVAALRRSGLSVPLTARGLLQ
jgi:hypothetical protein